MLVSYAARTQTRPDMSPARVDPHIPSSPARLSHALEEAPRGYPRPDGAGVVAWLAASTIAFVLALICLGASWVGAGLGVAP